MRQIEMTPDIKHSLYVYGCVNTVINLSTKINQIQIDACKKVSLVCTGTRTRLGFSVLTS
jgi:hypothetical protein